MVTVLYTIGHTLSNIWNSCGPVAAYYRITTTNNPPTSSLGSPTRGISFSRLNSLPTFEPETSVPILLPISSPSLELNSTIPTPILTTTPTSIPSHRPASETRLQISTPYILGGALGGFALIAIAGLAFYFLSWKQKTAPQQTNMIDETVQHTGQGDQLPEPVGIDSEKQIYELPSRNSPVELE